MKYDKLLRLVERDIYNKGHNLCHYWYKLRGIGYKTPPPFCTALKVGQHKYQILTDVEGFEKALAKLNEKSSL
tara:strand:+ start:1815 stop:2033 length:219 start_codon:yes stop_codon:yes gene_type:complete